MGDVDGYEIVFDCEYKLDGHFIIYSNRALTSAVMRSNRMNEEQGKYDIIFSDDELSSKSKISLIPESPKIVNHYRIMWTKKAKMRQTNGYNCLVAADGKIVGVISLSSGSTYGSYYSVVLSDATPPHTKYKRLSKLVLYILSSQEFLDTINRHFMWEHKGFATIAYTNRPVSQKYRGVFKLVKREEIDGEYKYKLTYQTRGAKTATIKQAYKEWYQKYGSVTEDSKRTK